jgi:hypothetical protein
MWQAPTASDKEIIALRAQIASLKCEYYIVWV